MLKPTAGDTLRHARWAKRLTIKALSEKSEVSMTTIVKVEKGEEVRGDIVHALAKELGLEADDLFDRTEAAS